MNDLFDRRINVYMYGEDYEEIGAVVTPDIGPKPEIKVEGVLISSTYSISTKVTITNIERSVPVESVAYLYVEMFYGEAKSSSLKKGVLYTVQYADQSKQPPDRQVCFNCIVAGVSPDILARPCSIGALDHNGFIVSRSIDYVARTFIGQYNYAVETIVKNEFLKSKLLLNSAPLYKMPEYEANKFKSKDMIAYHRETSFADVLDAMSYASVEKEEYKLKSDLVTGKGRKFYALHFYIEDQNLVIASNPYVTRKGYATYPGFSLSLTGSGDLAQIPFSDRERVLELAYVLSSYRCGSVVYCTTLFDPRIQQNTVIRINRNAVVGKRTAGNLIPITQEIIEFRAVGSISFVFSTYKENYMKMQGTINKEILIRFM